MFWNEFAYQFAAKDAPGCQEMMDKKMDNGAVAALVVDTRVNATDFPVKRCAMVFGGFHAPIKKHKCVRPEVKRGARMDELMKSEAAAEEAVEDPKKKMEMDAVRMERARKEAAKKVVLTRLHGAGEKVKWAAKGVKGVKGVKRD